MTAPSNPASIAIIAEDEDLGRLLLAESAKSAGLAPLVFDNGVDALQAALSQDVSIVLLDVDMPGMDGYCRHHISLSPAVI
jgi:CheY-like chemotaxis protein